MNAPSIIVNNLSKKYKIGSSKGASLRESFSLKLKQVFGRQNHPVPFWALKDVSFQVEAGEAIGIIGRNGAGKSTLLKIMSRITPPTEGRIELWGKTASLLEVGTGFHGELTGRENIFLNGTILGLSRKAIKEKYQSIVDFSGIEKFIDTPLKHYSSGMYVRLAFAVAAHIEPDILIVDEVLAVGDAEFQRRCIGKMEEVTSSGRTVIFVSHDMSSIKRLCTRAIYLSNGKVEFDGSPDEAVEHYLKLKGDQKVVSREGSEDIQLQKLNFYNESLQEIDSFSTGDQVYIEYEGIAQRDYKDVSVAICFNNKNNTRVTSVWSAFINKKFDLSKGSFKIQFHLPSIRLIPGEYEIISYVESNGIALERIDNLKRIHVHFGPDNTFVMEPKVQHGLYLEEFEAKLIENPIKV